MISILLTLILAAAVAGGVLLRRTSPWIGGSMAFTALAGIYFAWRPDDLSGIAHLMGVGRGADLLLYIWVVVSFLAIVALMLRLRALREQITLLARHAALGGATPPGQDGNTSRAAEKQ
jgi:hypothetical protein